MAQDTPLLELPPVRSRDEIIARLRGHEAEIRKFGATALYLFGSAARDELRDDSDIDLFIDYDPAADFSLFEQIAMQEAVMHLLHREVDLLTRGGLHHRLRDGIIASSQRVF
jgi:uncharacterized protein